MLEDQYDPILDTYYDKNNSKFNDQHKVALLQYMGYLSGKLYKLGSLILYLILCPFLCLIIYLIIYSR